MNSWFAVRSLFHFGVENDGANIFEECIVVFSGENYDEAFQKAEKESERYAKTNNFAVHPHMESYQQDGDDLIDGYEVWSEMYQSRLSLAEFFVERYEKYEYVPEDIGQHR
jgi:hypothetical protein